MLSDFSVASLLTSGVGSGPGHGVQLLTLVSGCHTRCWEKREGWGVEWCN